MRGVLIDWPLICSERIYFFAGAPGAKIRSVVRGADGSVGFGSSSVMCEKSGEPTTYSVDAGFTVQAFRIKDES